MTGSGLFCHLIGINTVEELQRSFHKGKVVETFVHSELLKHIDYSATQPKLYHYRTNDKKEIDFIIERGDKIFVIEAKSSKTVKKEDFKHIINFQNKSNKNITGIVFYTGNMELPFGNTDQPRFAIPLNVFF